MSEKRFIMEDGVLKYGETGEPVKLYDVVDLLNEQQATIERLQNDIIRKDEVIRILKEWLKKR